METTTLDRYIEITPGILGGKPRIAGHRIRVQDVAVWHEHLGMSVDEIANQYDLKLSEIHAALAYYFDHVDEINEHIRKDDEFVEEMRKKYPSLVAQKLKERAG
jgi:uncharacterized protein (DUF433 family)